MRFDGVRLVSRDELGLAFLAERRRAFADIRVHEAEHVVARWTGRRSAGHGRLAIFSSTGSQRTIPSMR